MNLINLLRHSVHTLAVSFPEYRVEKLWIRQSGGEEEYGRRMAFSRDIGGKKYFLRSLHGSVGSLDDCQASQEIGGGPRALRIMWNVNLEARGIFPLQDSRPQL